MNEEDWDIIDSSVREWAEAQEQEQPARDAVILGEFWGSRPREGVMALRLLLFSLPRPYLQGHSRLARPWAVALLHTSRQF
jgi:hypothetical protein